MVSSLMSSKRQLVTILIIIITCLPGSFAWDNEELELFDLVEEVTQNFYTVLAVEQTASNNDIKKAYRRLSLQLHPDKNKEEGAEEKFRQLVSVYEVLKDDEKRRRYDEILLNGLPSWRQPVFYYRRVRKLSLIELILFLFVLATGGQYLFVWSVYLEKKYELEEVLMYKFKKKERKAKKSKRQEENSNETIIAEISNQLPKPRFLDLLPFQVCVLLYTVIVNIPHYYQTCKNVYIEAVNKTKNSGGAENDDDLLEDDDSASNDEMKRRNRRKKQTFQWPDFGSGGVLADFESESLQPILPNVNSQDVEHSDATSQTHKSKEWTEDDVVALTRAINKFPGGTMQRWDKIAAAVERPVSDVLAAAKRLKSNSLGVAVPASVQGITGAVGDCKNFDKRVTDNLSDNFEENFDAEVSTSENEEVTSAAAAIKSGKQRQRKTVKVPPRTAMVAEPLSPKLDTKNSSSTTDRKVVLGLEDGWDQVKQKTLELALVQFPKGTVERWDRIANCIEGKTKEECIQRYQQLVDIVKKKRQLSSS